MSTWLLDLLVFLTAFLAVFGASAVLLDLNARERRRLSEELSEQHRRRERSRVADQDLSQIAALASNRKSTPWQRLAGAVEQSGIDISIGRLLMISLGLSTAGGILCYLLTTSILLGMTGAVVAGILPSLCVVYARHRRLENLLAQLPDAFDLMSRVLRSGQTVAQAMRLVAEEFSEPLSLEFFRCQEQMNLGMSPELALHDLTRRIGLMEMKIFAVAVLVQRQTGGNLSELFDKMGMLVRERFRIRGKVQSLTAQGRMQAIILLSLPVGMFALLMAVSPKYELVLLQYPMLIVAALAMMGAGALWINRIIHFDF